MRQPILNKRHFLSGTMLLLMLPLASPSDASSNSGYVRVANVSPGDVVWLRSGPASTFKRVKPLPYNARHIRNYGCQAFETAKWCQVRYLGLLGWVSERYLIEEKTKKVFRTSP